MKNKCMYIMCVLIKLIIKRGVEYQTFGPTRQNMCETSNSASYITADHNVHGAQCVKPWCASRNMYLRMYVDQRFHLHYRRPCVTRTEINFFIRIFIPTDAGVGSSASASAKRPGVTIAARDKGSINRTVKEGERYPDESLILKIPNNKSDAPSADIEHIRRSSVL